MIEYYPFFVGGRLEGAVRTFGDYLEVVRPGRKSAHVNPERNLSLKEVQEMFRSIWLSTVRGEADRL